MHNNIICINLYNIVIDFIDFHIIYIIICEQYIYLYRYIIYIYYSSCLKNFKIYILYVFYNIIIFLRFAIKLKI